MDLTQPATAPAKNRRRSALAACAVLAIIVNAGAIGLVAETTQKVGASASSGRPALGPAVVLVSAPVAPSAPDYTQAAGDPPAPPHRHLQRPSPPAIAPVAHTTLVAAAPVDPVQPSAIFFGYREVDEPAFPVNDWNIDIDALNRIGVQRLAFEILVSDRGEVVGCSVLEPTELPDDVKRSLEKRLAETVLLPARRAGQLVASVRRIELSVVETPVVTPLGLTTHPL